MSYISEALSHLREAFGTVPNGVLQIGAHEGQERTLFAELDIRKAVFVEPNPAVFARLGDNLIQYPGFIGVNSICTEFNGENVTFNIASNEESSSIFPLGRHGSLFPDITYTGTLNLKGRSIDDIFQKEAFGLGLDTLVLDTQGSELAILKGGRLFLQECIAIFVETSEVPLYEGGCALLDLIEFLQPLGFGLKWSKMGTWKIGDALFVKDV